MVDSIWKSAGIEGQATTFANTEKILSNLPVETKRDDKGLLREEQPTHCAGQKGRGIGE